MIARKRQLKPWTKSTRPPSAASHGQRLLATVATQKLQILILGTPKNSTTAFRCCSRPATFQTLCSLPTPHLESPASSLCPSWLYAAGCSSPSSSQQCSGWDSPRGPSPDWASQRLKLETHSLKAQNTGHMMYPSVPSNSPRAYLAPDAGGASYGSWHAPIHGMRGCCRVLCDNYRADLLLFSCFLFVNGPFRGAQGLQEQGRRAIWECQSRPTKCDSERL